jgi:hypothetical protein
MIISMPAKGIMKLSIMTMSNNNNKHLETQRNDTTMHNKMAVSIMTLSITTLSIMAFSIQIFSIKMSSIMTLSIKTLSETTTIPSTNGNVCRSRYVLLFETSKVWTVILLCLSRLGVPRGQYRAFAGYRDH